MPVPSPLITRSPDRLSGAAVFAGTRVPVQTRIDHLEAADAPDAFVHDDERPASSSDAGRRSSSSREPAYSIPRRLTSR